MRTLVSQTTAYKTLQESGGNLHHAYLFLFPDATFLKRALPFFAELFLDSERAKTLVQSGAYVDCITLPEEGKKFTVDNAKTILEESVMRPVEGDKKLFLISDFSDANVQAQNKLLKLLEEPPTGVYFLIGATIESTILPTILSRVEKWEIQPFSKADIVKYLERNYPASPLAREIAEASGGLPSKAESILSGGYLNEVIEGAYSLLLSPQSSLPMLCRKLADTKHKKELITLLKMVVRDALFLRERRKDLLLPATVARSQAVADKFSARRLLCGQTALSEAEKQLRFNGVFSQVLEIALIEFYK